MERVFDSNRASAMLTAYRAGASLNAIAAEYGITHQRVHQLLARTPGFVPRPRGTTRRFRSRDAVMKAQREQGMTLTQIASAHGLTHSAVWATLERIGAPRRPRLRSREEAIAHFWSMVAKGDGCWEMPGKTPGRHRTVTAAALGGRRYAHHLGYELGNGPITPGLWVLHKCDNPPCVRPDHLYLGTPKDNSQDRERRGRGGKRRKITLDDRAAILASTEPVDVLAERYGVATRTIYWVREHAA